MTPEQAQQYASQMMAAMVISGPGGAAPCCVNGTCSLHGAPGGTTTVAPTEEGGPAAPAMTEQEQLAFFESLTRKS